MNTRLFRVVLSPGRDRQWTLARQIEAKNRHTATAIAVADFVKLVETTPNVLSVRAL